MRIVELMTDQEDLSDELFEMANLTQKHTGLSGIIYISSKQGSHGPRVKWYPERPNSQTSPCLSVSIDADPIVRNLNLPDIIANRASDTVSAWVAMNHIGLLNFWNNGYNWTVDEVNAFIDGLRKFAV